MVITISDEYLGLVVVRPYTKTEATHKSIRICSGRILDICFNSSNYLAVLNEDQSVTIWKIVEDFELEKSKEEFKLEGNKMTRIKWNPYDNNEIICFSEKEICLIKANKPGSEITLLVSDAISDISFIPKLADCISYNLLLDLLIVPKTDKRILLAHCDLKEKKLTTSDIGVSVTRPAFIFNESDRNEITIINAKEFREITIKSGNVDVSTSMIPLHDFISKYSGPFVPYYSMKTMLVYLVFPEDKAYVVLRHRKKKLLSHAEGTIKLPPEISGIIGIFVKDVGDIIYLYNNIGIYAFIAKKFVHNSEKPKESPNTHPKEVKEEAKEKKEKGNFTKEKPASKQRATSSEEQNIRDFIRREIDGAIKTTVLPIVESHMKHFESEFQSLMTREITQLKRTVQDEAAKMQSTGKVFEDFMGRMLDISAKFTNTLEGQMTDLALSSRANMTQTRPYIAPSRPLNYNEFTEQTNFPWNERVYKP